MADLNVSGNSVEFFLPTTVAPRYHPLGASDAVRVGSLSGDAQQGLSVSVQVDMASAVVGVTSPTHPITITTPTAATALTRCTVALAAGHTHLEKDLVLLVETATPHAPRMLWQRSAQGTQAAMVTLVPQLALGESKSECVFVVDRSGSMGDKIKDARDALQVCKCLYVQVCVCWMTT